MFQFKDIITQYTAKHRDQVAVIIMSVLLFLPVTPVTVSRMQIDEMVPMQTLRAMMLPDMYFRHKEYISCREL
jgi:hypothetical protein